MSAVIETKFGVGTYWTTDGRQAVVDAVTDGMLVGRINLQQDAEALPIWYPTGWRANGVSLYGGEKDSLRTDRVRRIKKTYWVNIYTSGPGQLRKDWEESLVEASRCEEEVLCRVEVKVDAAIGEGLK